MGHSGHFWSLRVAQGSFGSHFGAFLGLLGSIWRQFRAMVTWSLMGHSGVTCGHSGSLRGHSEVTVGHFGAFPWLFRSVLGRFGGGLALWSLRVTRGSLLVTQGSLSGNFGPFLRLFVSILGHLGGSLRLWSLLVSQGALWGHLV